ncbi:MAG: class I SAM-dependent methyltransferase [Bacteroidetes bacterium]|nr:class I SAM-dependent methyltransferase [Bacteroidota bacterium]
MHLLTEEIERYIEAQSSPQDEVLAQLTRETHLKVQMPQMLSGNIQGQFLSMISHLCAPKRILEIGTFTGYSAICLAQGLTPDGKLITIDINEELKPMCDKYFELAGVSSKITGLYGDARRIIPTIDEQFDIVFIDADKHSYCTYYDLVFDKVRAGGYIIADNVLWSGKVVNEVKDKDTQAIHQYNEKVSKDARVHQYILPLRDGLNIARKL